jgi:hypothetical protein
VVYWRKDGDRDTVYKGLQSLGVYAVQKAAKLPAATNALWFGTDVDVETAKTIANELLRSGVKLNYFGYFADRSSKISTIEIGHSAANLNGPQLTVADIARFSAK